MIEFTRPKTFAVIGLTVVLILVALILWRPSESSSPSGTAATPTAPSERVLHFPEDRSIGSLSVRDWNSTWNRNDGWRFLAKAQGTVTVPVGKELMLDLEGGFQQDLSALSVFGEHDLQWLRSGHVMNLITDGSNGLIKIESNSTITDDDLRFIREFRSLRELALLGERISDAGIKQLRSLPRLEVLILIDVSITDEGLAYLQSIRSLKRMELTVIGSLITPNGQALLRQALPNCRIVIRSYPGTPTPFPPTRVPVS